MVRFRPMNVHRIVGGVAATAILTSASLVVAPRLGAQSPPKGREVVKIYAETCANCHGPNLQGAQFSSLIDADWKFGSDDASLTKSIREGHPQQGMPPMGGGSLNEQEIRGLVIFIRETAAKAAREKATVAKPAADTVVTSEAHSFKLETVVEGVTAPWGIAFLPDGRMLVTEKAGALRIVEQGKLLAQPVRGLPAVWSKGQGGLLDVGVHPDYARNGWIYLSYSDPLNDETAMTAILRGKLRDGALVEQETLFKAAPELYVTKSTVHFGSRFVFDGRGHVFFSIGERGQGVQAQDLSRPNGKVHRINDDGSVPKDNPFVGRQGALPTIWTYGNRNPQGLTMRPGTNELWEVEHGPRGGDELNLLTAGQNYGWPVITYGMNYDGSPMAEATAKPDMQQPVTYWVPSIAVASLAFYNGAPFPKWKGDLLVSTLAQQELRRLVLKGNTVTKQEVLFSGVGRLRDIVVGPDGYIYVAFNQPDRIARLVPANAAASSSAAK
jgi:glucose/arabinose dehydrogenase